MTVTVELTPQQIIGLTMLVNDAMDREPQARAYWREFIELFRAGKIADGRTMKEVEA